MPSEIATYLTTNGPFAFGLLCAIGVIIWQARQLEAERKYSRDLQELRLSEVRVMTDAVNKFSDTVETVMTVMRKVP